MVQVEKWIKGNEKAGGTVETKWKKEQLCAPICYPRKKGLDQEEGVTEAPV